MFPKLFTDEQRVKARKDLARSLTYLEKALTDSTYLVGNTVSIADLLIVTELDQVQEYTHICNSHMLFNHNPYSNHSNRRSDITEDTLLTHNINTVLDKRFSISSRIEW